MIFCISDDNQVVGLEDPKGDADKISETIKTRLDPIPEFKLRFHKTEDGKVLVILDVYKGEETHIIIQEMEYWKLMFVLVMKV